MILCMFIINKVNKLSYIIFKYLILKFKQIRNQKINQESDKHNLIRNHLNLFLIPTKHDLIQSLANGI